MHRHKLLLWIAVAFALGVGAAFWAGSRPAVGSVIEPAIAVLMIVSGIVLAAPVVALRPVGEPDRKARRRTLLLGTAFVLMGIARLAPSPTISIGINVVTMLVLLCAVTGFPKRAFATRTPRG